MIESGLYQFLTTNSAVLALLGSSKSVYFSVLPKQPVLPALRIFRVASPNAAETLDLPTAGTQTIAGRFQFDAIAGDSFQNPLNPSGYLSAAMLSRAVRAQLLAQATDTLPDGSLLQDVRIHDEFDQDFEQGGSGYIYRRALDISILFQEGSYPYPSTPHYYDGDGAPTALHNNGDVYLDLFTGNIYEQAGNAWGSPIGNVGGGTAMPSLIYHKVAAAGTNAANIKAAAGVVTGWKIYNNTNYPIFVKLFNETTVPVPGTDTPLQTIGVDAGDGEVENGAGFTYTTGIGIAITKGIADTDSTPLASGDCVVDIFYQ